MKTLALVESPTQLLNVLEWAHRHDVQRDDLTTVVLAPRPEQSRLQLRRMTEIARNLRQVVRWHEPRLGAASTARTVRAMAGELIGIDRLVVGDPFSGVIQVVLGVTRVPEVVIVDDGTATMEFARLWASGEELVRWHTTRTSPHRRQIASLARRRMTAATGSKISLFSCLPLEVDLPVVRNDFGWVRSQYGQPTVKITGDLVGTSLVETGVVDEEAYLRGVGTLATRYRVDRYFAHRKEEPAKLARISALGLEVLRPELPIELAARMGPVGRYVVSFPSTVVHTLPTVLSDTAAELVVCDIAQDWFTAEAAATSGSFLSHVSTTARRDHGLAATAC
ncbi:hypothetical protein [Microlunatus speluncae]|uniref:hypothetical protein n=1 Tax=Microlunatus speluncae TaxID=2594267 RepID=UPI0012660A30|nr:hypothetical protein [Microlunatus speluncae]